MGKKGSEYTTWITYDTHARAYEKLSDDRSARMVRILSGPNAQPAIRNPLCLGCHVNPDVRQLDKGSVKGPGFSVDGVGCESCHGPAGGWLRAHYSNAWNTTTKQQEKRELGFANTKDLVERAQKCVTCHVGTATLDVNHDLLAAGHPRLSFEFSSFLAAVPKHWSETKEKERYPDFEARAWVIGQIVSAQAALRLLEHRAKTATKPWPEFAEYDCYACHHDLQADSWRQKRGYGSREPGTLPWASWYTAMLPRAFESAGKEPPDLAELTEMMQRPSPDRDKVAAEARRIIDGLHDVLGSLEKQQDAGRLKALLDAISEKDQQKAKASWDSAFQYYRARMALNEAIGDLDRGIYDRQQSACLQDRLRQLRFRTGYDSPKNFEPE